MSLKFDRLVSLLRELFQLDQPDLDFGLYRIMHAKAAEVTQFLEKDLLPQVRKAFEQYQPADKAAVQKRLAEAIAAAESLGVDPNTNPKVAAIKAELAAAVDLSALEDEVFDHLHSFFRRYYSEGDFLSKRVYKPGVYAVPYEGEEVMLHWANKDQYYIKTSEYLRDYAFRLKPDSDANPMRVHFRLAEVAEGEHGNIKAAEGKDRVFILAPAGDSGRDFIEIEKVNGQDELVIRFAYRPATMEDWTEDAARSATEAAAKKPPTQKVLSDLAIKAILAVRDPALTPWIAELAKPHVKVGGEQADYSRLQGHLSRYTARHTFDYFIHKDLGGFLRRELDFYIKNEVMHLDDIESETAAKVEQYLSKIKVIRTIAGKVIAFVSQLENFQKRLWLKKKFVTQTTWCVRIGSLPSQLYPEVIANAKQVREWVELLSIDSLGGDLLTAPYTAPLTQAFLAGNPSLLLDTRHFTPDFVARLLDSLDSLDLRTDVVLCNGENFQVLSMLEARYRDQVRCIYIDPPYNTGNDSFSYKDNYQHSSWQSMMHCRLGKGVNLLSTRGVVLASINDIELGGLRAALDDYLGTSNYVGTLVWKGATDNNPTRIAVEHEYIICYAKDSEDLDDQWSTAESDTKQLMLDTFTRLRGESKNHAELVSKWEAFTTESRDTLGDLYRYRRMDEHGPYAARRNMENPGKPGYTYDVVHPVTKKPCERPYWGWRFPPATMDKLLAEQRIIFGETEQKIPELKVYLQEVKFPLRSVFAIDARKGSNDLDKLFGSRDVFKNPKPVELLEHVLPFVTATDCLVVDFFAGSGTTAHAVVAMNRKDGVRRKAILVDISDRFDTVMVPRIKKVAFAVEWKDGRPTRIASNHDTQRGPDVVKVVRVESYEDALNNLLLKRSPEQESLLRRPESKALAEQYMLRYMLDTETRGSPSLLNIQKFTDPTAYTMRIKRPGTDESVVTAVDLIETFNWLIGLTVNHFAAPQTFEAAFERDSEGRLRLKGTGARGGRLKPDAHGKWWFRTVTGKAPDGKRVLVIWRKRPGGDTPEGIEQDNLVLDEWFRKQGYSTSDAEFDLIYVNSDNNLGNLRQEEADEKGLTDTGWKVRIIEEDFHRLMFDTEGT